MKKERSEREVRCAFNGYCKRILRNLAINAHRDRTYRRGYEVPFSELTKQQFNSLCYLDSYWGDEDNDLCIDGKRMTKELLEEAIGQLAEDLQTIINLYYHENLSDAKIGQICQKPRSTIQYRRSRALKMLKKYLEENANDWEE